MTLEVSFSRFKHWIAAGTHESQVVENQTVPCQFPVVPPFSKGSSVVLSLLAAGGTAADLRPTVCGWCVSQNVV